MTGPRATLLLLRVFLVLHSAAVILQPVMAGYFLAGEVDAMDWHSPIGSTLWMLSFLQFFAAVLYWRPGGGRLWPALATLGLFLAEMTQMIVGHSRSLTVHVPLGTAIVAAVLLMTAWSFRASARRGRHQEVTR